MSLRTEAIAGPPNDTSKVATLRSANAWQEGSETQIGVQRSHRIGYIIGREHK